jgi:hypothetical protein
MSYQRRGMVIGDAVRGPVDPRGPGLLARVTGLQRLALAACNGDWPADNGQRETVLCPRCGIGWATSTVHHGRCPDCRQEDLVRATLKPCTGWVPEFQGDPRGAVLTVVAPSGRRLAVPPRER